MINNHILARQTTNYVFVLRTVIVTNDRLSIYIYINFNKSFSNFPTVLVTSSGNTTLLYDNQKYNHDKKKLPELLTLMNLNFSHYKIN